MELPNSGTIKKILFLIFIGLNLFSAPVASQKYTVARAHAHNDYLHPTPFYSAWKAGFGSIEADVFPVVGELLVAHDKKDINPEQTLQKLYLQPLLEELQKDSQRKIILLVDLKENYASCLQILLPKLAPLKKYLSTQKHKNRPLTLIITGARPVPAAYKNYPDFIFFDDDLKLPHTPAEWKRVGLVSLSFERYSTWKGQDSLPEKEKNLLEQVVDSVHKAHKQIRFWAAPDNQKSWTLQMNLGVDFVGTDQINTFSAFLEKE